MASAVERSSFVLGLGVGLAGLGVLARLPIGDGGRWALLFLGVALAWVGFFPRRSSEHRPPTA